MSRRALRAGLVLLALAGAWQAGQGAWIHAKAWLAQRLLADAWEATLAAGGPVRPWPWADTAPAARLRVPALGVDQVVLADDSGEALAFGPGLTGEAEGTVVLSGHRDTHFRFLRRLAPGQRIVLEARDGIRAYTVARTAVIDARRQGIPAVGDALVLVTCYPFDAIRPGGPLRYVVHARPVAGKLAAASP